MRRATRLEIRPEDLAGMRCAQYIRDSTKDQAEGFGPEIQRRANRAFLERYGLIDTGSVYEEYVSAGSVRGRNELRRALEDMKSGRYQVLLVGWTHRFARSTEDAARIKREIADAGGLLVYTAQGIISGQRSNRVGEKVLHVLDEEYRENLADLVAAGLLAKFEADGANGLPPLGTKHVYIRRDGSIADGPERHTRAVRVLNEVELPTLRALLGRYAEFGSYRKTADWLNAGGYRTHSGGLFTTASIKTIILNPFYGPEEVVRYHARYDDMRERSTPKERQILPDDIHGLWQRGQEKRESHTRRYGSAIGRHIYPLHPVLHCAYCDSVYHGQFMKNERYSKHAGQDKGCGRPFLCHSTLLEDQLAAALVQIQLPRDWRSQIRRLLNAPQRDESAEQRAKLEKMLEKLRYQHLCDAIDDETFRREVRPLKVQLDALTANPSSPVHAYGEPAEMFRSVGRIVGHPALRRRDDAMLLFRRFCELAFSRIEVSGSRIQSIAPQAKYRELFAISVATPGIGLVRSRGLEPPRPCGHMDLNHARLPIPPRPPVSSIVVPREGLEPSRPRGHRFLRPARLPVPPSRPVDSILSGETGWPTRCGCLLAAIHISIRFWW